MVVLPWSPLCLQLAMKHQKELEQLQKNQREQLEKLEKFNEQVKTVHSTVTGALLQIWTSLCEVACFG